MAWLAGEHWLLDALGRGTDVYRITAGALYGMAPDVVAQEQRKLGKVVELASQFGLSAYGRDGQGGLYARARLNRIAITHDEAEHAINTYRKTHPKIVAFWCGMQALLTRVVLRGGRHRLGRVVIEHTQPDLIRVIRPSGHYQCLWDPEFKGGEYRGMVEYTGRLKDGSMGRVSTYGSKLAQGVTQGTAADLLLEAMTLAEARGFPPVMSVHDEIVAEVPDDGRDHAAALGQLLSENQSEWSKGIPIVCDRWQARRFQ
jgi:DNA polymerase